MTRWVLVVVCLALGLSGSFPQPANAQGRAVGGGIGYAFDEHSDFLTITGIGWLPVKRTHTVFSPLVLAPRVQILPGFDLFQVDLDAIWDIPVAPELTVRPYIGVGVGLSHLPGQTTPLFNFDAGFRIKKPTWRHQFAAEIHYSAGLDYSNTMTMNFIVLFPIGK